MNCIWFLGFLFVFGKSVIAGIGDGVQIAGTNDKCAEFCLKTWKEDASAKSCQQGCRLYSVLQFVDKTRGRDAFLTEPNSTAIATSCQNECKEAYKDVSLKGACVDGCVHQTPFTAGSLRIVMDNSSPMFPFAQKLMSDAFGKFDDIHNRMMEHFENVRKWFKNDPFGGSQDSGLFDRVDSQFRSLFNQMAGDFGGRRMVGGKEDVAQNGPASTVNPLFAYAKGLAQNRQDGSRTKTPLSNLDENGEPILIVKIIKSDGLFDGDENRRDGSDANNGWLSFTQDSLDDKPHEPSPPLSSDDHLNVGSGMDVDADDTWLACFARRTHNLPLLTRWLLCVALMLSILCMIYLCLAVMRTSQQRRRRLYLQHKMGKSDAAFLVPPPTYEKVAPTLGYSMGDEEKQRESPPPAYEIAVGPTSVVQAGDASVKQV